MEKVDEWGFPIFEDNKSIEEPSSNKTVMPDVSPVIAAQYQKKDGTFYPKDYFFENKSNKTLQVGDIGLVCTKRVQKCVPVKITRINISETELEESHIDRSEMGYVKYKGFYLAGTV